MIDFYEFVLIRQSTTIPKSLKNERIEVKMKERERELEGKKEKEKDINVRERRHMGD